MKLPSHQSLLVFLALGLTTLATPGAQAKQSNPRVEGLSLYSQGRYNEAIAPFTRVLNRHPRDLEIRNKRGTCYLKLNQPDRALADFEVLAQQDLSYWRTFGPPRPIDPNSSWSTPGTMLPQWPVFNPEGWSNRGIALLMLGRDSEAAQSFRMALEGWPYAAGTLKQKRAGMASACEGLGQVLLRQGAYQDALAVLNEAVRWNPWDANAFAARGEYYLAVGRYRDALADYTHALALDPRHVRASRGRGEVLEDLGRNHDSLEDLNRALALNSSDPRAYSDRGALLAQMGRNQDSLADFDALLALDPKNANALKNKGGVLTRMGRHEEAIAVLNQSIQLDPSSSAAFQNRGAAYNSLGQYERAKKDLEKAIELDPDNVGAHANLGLACFGLGMYAESIKELNRAIELAPQAAIPYYNRAEILARLGDRAKAAVDYEKAVELEPRLTAAHAALARIRDEQGDSSGAESEYQRALELDPASPELLRMRADLRRQSGDWSGALADYERSIVLDPHDALTYVSRAWARLAAGVDGADFDARVYLRLRGYHDRQSAGMAVVAVLGALQQGNQVDATRALDEALVNLPRTKWPTPVLHYLRKEISLQVLLDESGSAHAAEAHAFVGLERLWAGDRETAVAHLKLAAQAPSRTIAHDIANATLKRLGVRQP